MSPAEIQAMNEHNQAAHHADILNNRLIQLEFRYNNDMMILRTLLPSTHEADKTNALRIGQNCVDLKREIEGVRSDLLRVQSALSNSVKLQTAIATQRAIFSAAKLTQATVNLGKRVLPTIEHTERMYSESTEEMSQINEDMQAELELGRSEVRYADATAVLDMAEVMEQLEISPATATRAAQPPRDLLIVDLPEPPIKPVKIAAVEFYTPDKDKTSSSNAPIATEEFESFSF
jgi:hypothetical protein